MDARSLSVKVGDDGGFIVVFIVLDGSIVEDRVGVTEAILGRSSLVLQFEGGSSSSSTNTSLGSGGSLGSSGGGSRQGRVCIHVQQQHRAHVRRPQRHRQTWQPTVEV